MTRCEVSTLPAETARCGRAFTSDASGSTTRIGRKTPAFEGASGGNRHRTQYATAERVTAATALIRRRLFLRRAGEVDRDLVTGHDDARAHGQKGSVSALHDVLGLVVAVGDFRESGLG